MGPRPKNLTPETAAKYREVIRLKRDGLTFDVIAERVGYASRQGAFEAFRAALKWWGQEATQEARLVENERIERLWQSSLQQLLAAERENTEQLLDAEGNVKRDADGNVLRQMNYSPDVENAIAGAVNVSRNRRGLLGLDAPKQMEISGQGGGPVITDVGKMFQDRMNEAQRLLDEEDAQAALEAGKTPDTGLRPIAEVNGEGET